MQEATIFVIEQLTRKQGRPFKRRSFYLSFPTKPEAEHKAKVDDRDGYPCRVIEFKEV